MQYDETPQSGGSVGFLTYLRDVWASLYEPRATNCDLRDALWASPTNFPFWL